MRLGEFWNKVMKVNILYILDWLVSIILDTDSRKRKGIFVCYEHFYFTITINRRKRSKEPVSVYLRNMATGKQIARLFSW